MYVLHHLVVLFTVLLKNNKTAVFPQSLFFGMYYEECTMRIDKYICDSLNVTRTQAKQLLSKGRVSVDGVCVRSSSTQVNDATAVVSVDSKIISYDKLVYIMMNKPSGVISASSDKSATTAIDLILPEDRKKDLFVAGRLDKDTTGFLLITNDGDFAHNILAPKNHIYKTYYVILENPIEESYRSEFEKGVVIDQGIVCKPARFEPVNEKECRLEICEGKFHQVKRMFASLGNKVVSLKREKISDISLDETLKQGEYRRLSDEELKILMNKITKKAP